MKPTRPTQPRTLCRAALALSAPFTPEQLLVAAYELDPEEFALRGYPQHPDARKLQAILYGARVLIAKGLLVCYPADGGERLLGISTLTAAYADLEPAPAPALDLPECLAPVADLPPLLLHMQQSVAFALFDAGRKEQIGLRLALAAWSVTRHLALSAAMEAVGTELRDRSTPTLRALGAYHDWAEERFAKHCHPLPTPRVGGKPGKMVVMPRRSY